jgi:peroxiredoxin
MPLCCFLCKKTTLSMSITIGQPAPQFTLTSDEIKQVSLADFKGKKVVIHFSH